MVTEYQEYGDAATNCSQNLISGSKTKNPNCTFKASGWSDWRYLSSVAGESSWITVRLFPLLTRCAHEDTQCFSLCVSVLWWSHQTCENTAWSGLKYHPWHLNSAASLCSAEGASQETPRLQEPLQSASMVTPAGHTTSQQAWFSNMLLMGKSMKTRTFNVTWQLQLTLDFLINQSGKCQQLWVMINIFYPLSHRLYFKWISVDSVCQRPVLVSLLIIIIIFPAFFFTYWNYWRIKMSSSIRKLQHYSANPL